MSAPLTIVVAIDANNGIGINNRLPWHLPEDLAHFKRTTSGHPIIMGRKTFESIGRPLPNRRNIVISRNAAWQHDGAETVTSIAAAKALVGDVPAFIIGGGQIFNDTVNACDRLIVTEIARTYECDAFFPAIDPTVWQETARETHHSDANDLDYAYVTYERRSAKAA